MDSLKATAHRAGLLYFLFMIIAITGEFLLPAFIVPTCSTSSSRCYC